MMTDFSFGCSNCWNGLQFQYDIFRYPRCLYVMSCYFVRFRIVVVSVNFMCKFTLLTVVIVKISSNISASKSTHFSNANPLRNTPGAMFLAINAAFHWNSTRTAHRINQVTFSPPAGHQNHTGSQYLVQRRLLRLPGGNRAGEVIHRTSPKTRCRLFVRYGYSTIRPDC